MCELTIYDLKGEARKKVMEGVVRVTSHDGKVLLEGIFGDSMEVEGRLSIVDIMAQEAIIVVP